MRVWIFIPIFILTLDIGCAHNNLPAPASEEMRPLENDNYARLMKNNTARTDQYSGLYQTFQADMTILNADVQTEFLKKKAYFLQWDQKTFQAEREKQIQEANAYSKFFLRFYSADPDYNDLHKGKTIWRVYLEYDGRKFEGKVQKLTEKFVELQTLYPQMDRFSTGYEVTFNVPMTTVQAGALKVILTSSLGVAQFTFPVVK